MSTSLPTIVADLHASQSQYPWVGVAYAVSQTALQPLYGRFSDLLGRKVGFLMSRIYCLILISYLQTVLYTSMLIFMIGSLLCGLANVRSLGFLINRRESNLRKELRLTMRIPGTRGHRWRWHCERCLVDNSGARRRGQEGTVVSSPECYLVCIRCRR